MNIVCLSTMGISSGYVVRGLQHAFPAMKLIRLRCDPKPRPLWKRLRRALSLHGIRRLEDRLFYSASQRHGYAEVQRLLYGDRPILELRSAATLPASVINHVTTGTLIRSLKPDVMITVGAPLLKPHIFGIPTVGTINLHFGIAPHYRGENTLFWPLYYGDERHIGVTIHQIDCGIDTGPMLAQGFVAIDSGDTEWTVEAKCARLGAELLIDLLQGETLQPNWQPPRTGTGRQFNAKSRHVWHDGWYFARRRWLGYRPQAFPRHVINYCQSDVTVDSEVLENIAAFG